MKNASIIFYVLLLVLSLLNIEYSDIKDFEFLKHNIYDVLMVLVCIVAIIFHIYTGSKAKQSKKINPKD